MNARHTVLPRVLIAVAAAVVAVTAVLAMPAAPASAASAGSGGWAWPLARGSASIVRGFDPPARPWLPGHRGVDLRGRPGQRVLAAGDGVVAYAGAVAGVGVVSVRHPNGLLTTYQPVRPAVHGGDVVRAGDLLGRLVARGSHCPPAACLHWGLRRGADYLDPLALVGAGTVRLLPLYAPEGPLPAPGVPAAGGVVLLAGALARRRRRVSRAGRRACRAAAARPSCASGRSGSP